jgi:hypothetical protein
VARDLDQDELIDHWTLVADELALVAGKRAATRLGFAVLPRFYTDRSRFLPYGEVKPNMTSRLPLSTS